MKCKDCNKKLKKRKSCYAVFGDNRKTVLCIDCFNKIIDYPTEIEIIFNEGEKNDK